MTHVDFLKWIQNTRYSGISKTVKLAISVCRNCRKRVVCRCRNKELLPKDWLRVRRTIYDKVAQSCRASWVKSSLDREGRMSWRAAVQLFVCLSLQQACFCSALLPLLSQHLRMFRILLESGGCCAELPIDSSNHWQTVFTWNWTFTVDTEWTRLQWMNWFAVRTVRSYVW